jgi:hypothetical protein
MTAGIEGAKRDLARVVNGIGTGILNAVVPVW